MSQPDPRIKELEDRLDRLVRTQIGFQTEVSAIRKELAKLRDISQSGADVSLYVPPPHQQVPQQDKLPDKWSTAPRPEAQPSSDTNRPGQPSVKPPSFGGTYEAPKEEKQPIDDKRPSIEDKILGYFSSYIENAQANLEKFIGENLISKIGIIILIVGVGIGAKYAIDNNLISPLTRIILGYIFGVGLLGLAVKLKSKYHDFSAVLLSGGMAIMYFITYFAYSSYQLISQPAAFVMMVIFTIFTVASALFYNRQVIAHIGLVGAYAVPFLLSNNSGNYAFLFGYMAVLNAGILAISIKKAWKPVFYTASVFTWVIFAAWFSTKFEADLHLYLALITLAVFFLIFYVTKIIHGVVHSEADELENIASATATTVIFYLFAFSIGVTVNGYSDRTFFFSYVACFALAILVSSYKYYGRILVYVVYPFTWFIFASWFFRQYSADQHFLFASVFASIYFLIFYGTTLFYRLVTEEMEMPESTGVVLTNSFVFYGFGYGIIDSRENLRQYEGLFTVAHGVFHLLVAQLINRFKPNAIDVIQTLAVLIITFATIAIPIQFDGNSVALIWSVEAAVLFYFGRERAVWLFECLAYPVMVLAAASMANVWLEVYSNRFGTYSALKEAFLNGDFITGLVFVAAFASIYFINRRSKEKTALNIEIIKPFGYVIAAVCLIALYNTFRMEIGNYFYMVAKSRNEIVRSLAGDIEGFNFITQLNYTMLFLIVLAFVNLRRVFSFLAGAINVALSVLTLLVSSTIGMYVLYELRVTYLNGTAEGLFGNISMNVVARFVTYIFIAATFVSLYKYSTSELLDKASTRVWRSLAYEALLYPCLLILTSCELMNVAAHVGIKDADKFGISILWGVFALAVIVIGIAKAKKHLRIGAFVLLGATLLKLFFFDATDLPTIPKTILFVSLGLLMLGISFLYNKFRNVIFASVGNDEEVEK